jgi:UDP-N-acetylmuramoyl-tripeptide--D-alanyl-D-alanine ligase
MGMYDLGEIAFLAKIARPKIGVVANVGPSHLERLGSIDRIAQAKSELPRSLPTARQGGIAILNADDGKVRAMAEKTRARVFTYGLSPSADLWADRLETEGLGGIRFRAHHGQYTVDVKVPMPGRHSVYTALSAAAVGLNEGLSWKEIITGLNDPTAQVRLITMEGPRDSVILDDTYNASPSSCIAALDLLSELQGRKIAVLGDMYELGEHELTGHQAVGRHASAATDILIVVGSLGREIGLAAVEAGMPDSQVSMVESNQRAIRRLEALIDSGSGDDMILIKGSRGMGMEEISQALARSQRKPEPKAKDPVQ